MDYLSGINVILKVLIHMRQAQGDQPTEIEVVTIGSRSCSDMRKESEPKYSGIFHKLEKPRKNSS